MAALVRVEKTEFLFPVFIGEVAHVTAEITYTSTHSLEVQVQVMSENILTGDIWVFYLSHIPHSKDQAFLYLFGNMLISLMHWKVDYQSNAFGYRSIITNAGYNPRNIKETDFACTCRLTYAAVFTFSLFFSPIPAEEKKNDRHLRACVFPGRKTDTTQSCKHLQILSTYLQYLQ